jgi:ubiquinone/menaquinone biosynthesis C-methylase UbiE
VRVVGKIKLQRIVNNFFSLPKVISYYSKCQLHVSERKLFRKYLKRKGKVLDVCCGVGRVAIPLAKIGFEVIGIDSSQKMINTANALKRRFKVKNVKFICIDASKIKFEKESFDYVLMLENSLEHIPSKDKRKIIIKKIYDVLKKDGVFITSFHSCFYPPKLLFKLIFHNIAYFFRRIVHSNQQIGLNDLILKIRKFNGVLFFHFFTPFEIKKIIKKSGFKFFEIIPINKLDKRKNRFKNLKIYDLLWPFTYQFWIAKKI